MPASRQPLKGRHLRSHLSRLFDQTDHHHYFPQGIQLKLGPSVEMSRTIEIVRGTERRAALPLLAVLLIGLSVANASAQPVDLQALCFDIISPRDAARLDGSILLDRCTGQTWLLSRSGKRSGMVGYRWTMLATEGGQKPLARPEPSMPAPVRPNTGKCFSFQGRQFCE